MKVILFNVFSFHYPHKEATHVAPIPNIGGTPDNGGGKVCCSIGGRVEDVVSSILKVNVKVRL